MLKKIALASVLSALVLSANDGISNNSSLLKELSNNYEVKSSIGVGLIDKNIGFELEQFIIPTNKNYLLHNKIKISKDFKSIKVVPKGHDFELLNVNFGYLTLKDKKAVSAASSSNSVISNQSATNESSIKSKGFYMGLVSDFRIPYFKEALASVSINKGTNDIKYFSTIDMTYKLSQNINLNLDYTNLRLETTNKKKNILSVFLMYKF